MYVLQNLHWFALLIGALVFFHELGHFVVAKACNVEVVRFSLGFGPKVLGFTRGETEYTLSLLPLGGYVKMAGEDPEEKAEKNPRGLAQKPLWQRTLIVLAGPLANVLLAFFVYCAMFVGPHTVGSSRLGVVSEGEPAWQGGLRPGDTVTAINGQPIDTWDGLQEIVGSAPDADLRLAYERDGHPYIAAVHSGQRIAPDAFGAPVTQGRIGVSLQYVLPIVAVVDEQSPAARAGLRTGDTIEQINDTKVSAWHEVRRQIDAAPLGEAVRVQARRGEATLAVSLVGAPYPATLLGLTRQSAADGRGPSGYLGLVSRESVVAEVVPGSPAAAAGVQPGDRLLTLLVQEPNDSAVTERAVGVWSIDLPLLGLQPNAQISLALQRGRDVHRVRLLAEGHFVLDEYKQSRNVVDMGLHNDVACVASYTKDAPVGLGAAMAQALTQVQTDISFIGRGIARMVRGQVPLSTMGGPIMLFVIAEKSAKRGWEAFGRAMAMTSVNLGLLNVLPIPVLDGGHLLFFAIEAVLGKPPSLRVREWAQMIGLGLLLMLMVVVFRNDIVRFLLGGV